MFKTKFKSDENNKVKLDNCEIIVLYNHNEKLAKLCHVTIYKLSF